MSDLNLVALRRVQPEPFTNLKISDAAPDNRRLRLEDGMRSDRPTPRYDDDGDFDGPPIVGIGILLIAVVVSGAAAGWFLFSINWHAAFHGVASVIDWIAPTAAQAREEGMTQIVERLQP
ncbi:hypothetical protein [Paracoccus laeviglucosivorans]|uniref:Uncharacterized protein n=1 Tax=Paracoccus laeviglucosivorans TaxID=1197861 RepID=A0A521CWX2_9RHOB|nr:hypothetical protein [Paracoccus laeviglucosivorans]SMO63918.1 hypothetical protein SAMN06265221_105224 [Paracoccus laeviglucosivorans]